MAFAISNFFGGDMYPEARTPIRLMGSENDGRMGWVWGPTIASSLGPQNTLIRLCGWGQRFAGSGRVGSKKIDPWTTLISLH